MISGAGGPAGPPRAARSREELGTEAEGATLQRRSFAPVARVWGPDFIAATGDDSWQERERNYKPPTAMATAMPATASSTRTPALAAVARPPAKKAA